jgi:hypothetical protein
VQCSTGQRELVVLEVTPNLLGMASSLAVMNQRGGLVGLENLLKDGVHEVLFGTEQHMSIEIIRIGDKMGIQDIKSAVGVSSRFHIPTELVVGFLILEFHVVVLILLYTTIEFLGRSSVSVNGIRRGRRCSSESLSHEVGSVGPLTKRMHRVVVNHAVLVEIIGSYCTKVNSSVELT